MISFNPLDWPTRWRLERTTNAGFDTLAVIGTEDYWCRCCWCRRCWCYYHCHCRSHQRSTLVSSVAPARKSISPQWLTHRRGMTILNTQQIVCLLTFRRTEAPLSLLVSVVRATVGLSRVVGNVCCLQHRNKRVTSIVIVIVRWSRSILISSTLRQSSLTIGKKQTGRLDNVRYRRRSLPRRRRLLLLVHLLLFCGWWGARAGPVSPPITPSFHNTTKDCRSSSSITMRHLR
jgi:hypothetical protein